MSLTSERLAVALKDRPFRYYEQVGSTNDAALEWALDNAPSGAVVVADEQTTGRGRMRRHWHTPPGAALALSVVLRPRISVEYLQRITVVGGLAVAESLCAYVAGVAIKWPNDVLLYGAKVSGVLTEALWIGDKLRAVILGIGINVRVDFSETALQATSLENHANQPISRLQLLAHVLERLDYWMEHIHHEQLIDEWRRRLITIGRQVRISLGEEVVEGVATDVDSSGALLVTDIEGHQHRVLVGDVWQA